MTLRIGLRCTLDNCQGLESPYEICLALRWRPRDYSGAMNAQRVLDVLRAGGPLRVTELVSRDRALAADRGRGGGRARAAGLALGGGAPPRGARGRPARSLAFRADAGYVVGVDIGEYKVRCAVADLRGRVVAERVREFGGDGAAPGDPRTRSRPSSGRGVGASCCSRCVGCTGAMDTARGTVLFSSVFPGRLRPRRRASRCPARCIIENDCNLAVIAERWCGAARGPRRRRLRARGRAHRRGHHGRRPADARPRGRGRRAVLPRRVRAGARRARHRAARARALRRGAGGRSSRPRARATRRRSRSSSARSAGPATASSPRPRSSTPRSS